MRIKETRTTWLRHDARIGATSTVLTVSVSAVRKRLTHSEALLEHSLLRSPSAIHDQRLALRALDPAEHDEATCGGALRRVLEADGSRRR